MKIERRLSETDEDYAWRCAFCEQVQRENNQKRQEISHLSNQELCEELKKIIDRCGILGYNEYYIKEAIIRLQYNITL